MRPPGELVLVKLISNVTGRQHLELKECGGIGPTGRASGSENIGWHNQIARLCSEGEDPVKPPLVRPKWRDEDREALHQLDGLEEYVSCAVGSLVERVVSGFASRNDREIHGIAGLSTTGASEVHSGACYERVPTTGS